MTRREKCQYLHNILSLIFSKVFLRRKSSMFLLFVLWRLTLPDRLQLSALNELHHFRFMYLWFMVGCFSYLWWWPGPSSWLGCSSKGCEKHSQIHLVVLCALSRMRMTTGKMKSWAILQSWCWCLVTMLWGHPANPSRLHPFHHCRFLHGQSKAQALILWYQCMNNGINEAISFTPKAKFHGILSSWWQILQCCICSVHFTPVLNFVSSCLPVS